MSEELREQIKELEQVPPRKANCPYHPYEREGLHYDPFVANPICSDCFADQILSLIKQVGYLPIEPAQLEVLKFNQKEVLGLIPAQALLDYDRAKEVLEKVSQATIAHNSKEQLYRVRK